MGIELFESLCKLCKHRKGFGCAAYPARIPLEIREMYVDHRLPYDGDQGVRFAPKDTSTATMARLSRVRIRQGRIPPGRNSLDRRIRAVEHFIAFDEKSDAFKLWRLVGRCNRFSELPQRFQRLILDAEAKACSERQKSLAGEHQEQAEPVTRSAKNGSRSESIATESARRRPAKKTKAT
jgi:hypothetical protein